MDFGIINPQVMIEDPRATLSQRICREGVEVRMEPLGTPSVPLLLRTSVLRPDLAPQARTGLPLLIIWTDTPSNKSFLK